MLSKNIDPWYYDSFDDTYTLYEMSDTWHNSA